MTDNSNNTNLSSAASAMGKKGGAVTAKLGAEHFKKAQLESAKAKKRNNRLKAKMAKVS